MGPNHILDKGFQATTAIGQFRGVVLVANDQVKQVDTAAAASFGVAQENITADDATRKRIANIRTMGVSRCIAGAAGLTRMQKVTFDNQGRVVAATTGQWCIGFMWTASTAIGDHVDVYLNPGLAG